LRIFLLQGSMLLLNAASSGDGHLVQHCLEVGVAVNCKDKVGPPLQPRPVPRPVV
jgi:hypothetical protein